MIAVTVVVVVVRVELRVVFLRRRRTFAALASFDFFLKILEIIVDIPLVLAHFSTYGQVYVVGDLILDYGDEKGSEMALVDPLRLQRPNVALD